MISDSIVKDIIQTLRDNRGGQISEQLSHDASAGPRSAPQTSLEEGERSAWLQTIDALAGSTDLDHRDVAALKTVRRALPFTRDSKCDEEIIRLLINSPGTVFRRALAKSFSAIDRRFRSFDGWGASKTIERLASRSDIANAEDLGDLLSDIDALLRIVDGAPRAGISFSKSDWQDWLRQEERRFLKYENEYFVVSFGSDELITFTFSRSDLVAEVVEQLGDHYGAPAPEDGVRDTEDLHDATRTPAKDLGFFPTPEEIAPLIITLAKIYEAERGPKLRVLEPSAGRGHLARWAVSAGASVDCIELDAQRCEELKDIGIFGQVTAGDFIDVRPDQTGTYDRIIMNPPFDHQRDIDHVIHAMRFLKDDGLLVAIMSPGTEFRATPKANAFRRYMAALNAQWHDLPEESFVASGSYSNTIVLCVWNDGRTYFEAGEPVNKVVA